MSSSHDFPSIDELDAHGEPVSCGSCGRRFPGDPVLEVECPTCGAEKGEKCKRPSGWSGNFTHPHGDRDSLALAKGITPPCPQADDPDTPEEMADKLGVECEVDDQTDPWSYKWPWHTDGVTEDETHDTPADVDERVETLETAGLSGREAEVTAWKEQGLTHAEIAEKIGKSKSSVDEYSRRAGKKLEKARALIDQAGAVFE